MYERHGAFLAFFAAYGGGEILRRLVQQCLHGLMAHVQYQRFGNPVGMGRAFANRFQGAFQQGIQTVSVGGTR